MAVDEVELEQFTGQAASDWAASFVSALVLLGDQQAAALADPDRPALMLGGCQLADSVFAGEAPFSPVPEARS